MLVKLLHADYALMLIQPIECVFFASWLSSFFIIAAVWLGLQTPKPNSVHLKCPPYLKKAKRDKLKSNTRPTKMATDHHVCLIKDCDLRWYCLQYFRPWERACQRKVSVHWITQGKPVCSLVSKRIDTICTMFLEVCVTTMATYASIFC